MHERYSVQSATASSSATASAAGDSPDRFGASALYAFIFPNFMINRYGCWMDTNAVYPVSANECEVVFDYFIDRNELK